MTQTDLDTLGGRLKFARLRRGLRARELARNSNVKSESHVSLIESGRSFNDLDVLRKLATELDVSLDWLVNGGDVPSDLEAAAEPTTTFRHPSEPPTTDGDN